ncbi:MAG: ABC transporter substrate-binding protein [Desulfobacterales bacterium]
MPESRDQQVALNSCKTNNRFILIGMILLIVFMTAGESAALRTITDSRGRSVALPERIERVATVSDGLVEGVMTVFGVEEKLVGLGSLSLQKVWSYQFPGENGEDFAFTKGMNPVRALNPWFADLPLFANGPAINYETLAGLRPDLVILRLGSCNLPAGNDQVEMSLNTLRNMEIPVIVLQGPHFSGHFNPAAIAEEIRILGKVFQMPEKAEFLIDFIQAPVDLISTRTREISESEKPRILVLGLSPSARRKGAAGQVFGINTIESYFIENVVHAKNAFQEPGHFKLVSAEHLLALDPDVILLCTAAGYHPPRELYEAPYYRHLRQLSAVRQKRVFSLPWTPWNCEKRLEYPIEVMVMAKAAYPELFADIDLSKWLIDFYQEVYGVDEDTAEKLRSAQWMDWTEAG